MPTIPRFADHATHARTILREVLQACNPAAALRSKLPALLPNIPDEGRLVVLAIGKASIPMAAELAKHLPRTAEIILTHPPDLAVPHDIPGLVAAFPCDHPEPTPRNLHAARSVYHLVSSLAPEDTLVLLISGGGSAHLPLPAGSLTLDDLAEANRVLQHAGADIHQLNTVRKHTELLKGGLLAQRARGAAVFPFVLSDVLGDDLATIASGPAAPDPTTYADALAVLQSLSLTERLPAITHHLQQGIANLQPETPKPGCHSLAHVRPHIIIASNALALAAARHTTNSLGFHARGCEPNITLRAEHAGRRLAQSARLLAASPRALPAAWLYGGEWTVRVDDTPATLLTPTPPLGGPSQELALAAAIALDQLPNVALLAFSTDGRDGPTTAAGALVTGSTARALLTKGIHAHTALLRHDSHAALRAVDALLSPGPTGTNLNHIAVALAYAE